MIDPIVKVRAKQQYDMINDVIELIERARDLNFKIKGRWHLYNNEDDYEFTISFTRKNKWDKPIAQVIEEMANND